MDLYMCKRKYFLGEHFSLFYFSHSRCTKTVICFTSPWLSKSLLPYQMGSKWRQIKFIREKVLNIQDFGISYDLSWTYMQACVCIYYMTRSA